MRPSQPHQRSTQRNFAGISRTDEILAALKRLEDRIALIETHLGLQAGAPGPELPLRAAENDAEEKLELQLGQTWFARVGIVVLAMGLMFLLTFPYENLPSWVPSLFGYILAGGLALTARLWRVSFELLSRYLLGTALLLLFFTTLRLSHFSPVPALHSNALEVFLLLTVVAVNVTVAVRRQSAPLAAMSLALGFLTALLAEDSIGVFVIVTVMSAGAAILYARNRWVSIILMGTVFTYGIHLLWAINNPFFGNPLQLLTSPEINIGFILMYAVVYGAGMLIGLRDRREQGLEIVASFMNGPGAYALLLLLTIAAYPGGIVFWNLLSSVVFLCLAVSFWLRARSKYGTFVYAMLGYAALSVAIVAHFPAPDYFLWLCWQSVLVLSTAVWFRSRFIVVANFIIFVLIVAACLITSGTGSSVMISFGIVALVSARIMNWQKEKLELHTEMMRNAYLASALVVIPYALYHAVPSGFVSLSWLAVAAVYYLVSRLLKLRKYRWMALLTTSMTIVYVFLVDLIGVNPTIRIVSFLVLGSALMVISTMYSRRKNSARLGTG